MKNLKKLFSCVLVAFAFVMGAFFFTGCDSSPAELTSNMINLGYTAISFDGGSKTPAVTVTVEGNEIDSSEYSVTYSNNISVGTGQVQVTAKEGSSAIKGTVTVGFEITQANKEVSTLTEINNYMQNANYSSVSFGADFSLSSGETLTIAEGFTVNVGDYTLTNHGKIINNGTLIVNKNLSGLGKIENNGEIRAEVKTYEDLTNAFSFATRVVLASDIPYATDGQTEFFVCQNAKYEEITLDLMGHTLNRVLNINSSYNVKKLTITSTSGQKAKVNVVGINDCALYFRGTATAYDTFDAVVDNINFVGDNASIKTNGTFKSEHFNITLKNCDFDGTTTVGAYLPAGYNYRAEDCTFSGISGYYTKSGNHKLINCNFTATKETYTAPLANGNGCNETGSALILDSCKNYNEPLVVLVDGGNFESKAGHAIEEYATSTSGAPNFYSNLTLKGAPKYSSKLSNLSLPNFTFKNHLSKAQEIVSGLYENSLTPNTTYTASDFDEFYVELGKVENIQSVEKLTIGTTDLLLNQDVIIDLSDGIKIVDKAFFVEDGTVYVSAPVLVHEMQTANKIALNGREFYVNFGSTKKLNVTGLTSENSNNTASKVQDKFNEFILNIADETPFSIEYLNASAEDKFIIKNGTTYSLSITPNITLTQTTTLSISVIGKGYAQLSLIVE